MRARLVVVGSANADLVLTAPRFPRPGETLLGGSFAFHSGGKGANQAVAAARLGAAVGFVGRVGRDGWGERLRSTLVEAGVSVEHLQRDAIAPSGVAAITVVAGGENSIVVAPGANGRVSAQDVEGARAAIAHAGLLLLQGEIPACANVRAAEIAREHGVSVLWNAAPIAEQGREFLGLVDIVVVNQGEAGGLAGQDASAQDLARELSARGVRLAVLTLGAEGALACSGAEVLRHGAFPLEVIDTTAAGDAFVGAFAVARCEGQSLGDALAFACAAGGLAASVAGAMPSLPSRAAVERVLGR